MPKMRCACFQRTQWLLLPRSLHLSLLDLASNLSKSPAQMCYTLAMIVAGQDEEQLINELVVQLGSFECAAT